MSFQSAGVIGLGYVGLPLANLLVNNGLRVVGIEIDPSKIDKLHSGISYVADLSDHDIVRMMSGGKFEATADYSQLVKVQAVIICVPTPLNELGEPNLAYIQSAGQQIAQNQTKGQLIVLESTTYPGTTEEELLPIFQKNGWKAGVDFYLAYSPERINPGDRSYSLVDMPKIISGVTRQCMQKISDLYSPIYRKVIPVSSPKSAEMAKVLENSQRLINISFVNEMMKLCERMNIDIWEVIEAINSKPYGNLHFYPSSGVGGHCIPVDPLYLNWKAAQIGVDLEFIPLAKWVNDSMPHYISDRIRRLLPDSNLKDKSILIVGVTYKKDVDDLRESSALSIMSLLKEQGAKVCYHDPLVPKLTIGGCEYRSIGLSADIVKSVDCTVILVDHTQLNIDQIIDHAGLVFDTKNVTRKFGPLPNVFYL